MQINAFPFSQMTRTFFKFTKINHHTDLLDSINSENIFITQYSCEHHMSFLLLSFL